MYLYFYFLFNEFLPVLIRGPLVSSLFGSSMLSVYGRSIFKFGSRGDLDFFNFFALMCCGSSNFYCYSTGDLDFLPFAIRVICASLLRSRLLLRISRLAPSKIWSLSLSEKYLERFTFLAVFVTEKNFC